MKKKELLKLIQELQTEVAILKTTVALLQPNIITIPHIWTSPGTLPYTLPVITCQHEYPEGGWGSTLPPCCKKCGVPAYSTTITCTTTSGGTQADPQLTEYIQKNTKN